MIASVANPGNRFNLSTSLMSLRRWFIQHGEKLLFAFGVVVLVLSCWALIHHQPYHKQPQDLAAMSATLTQQMLESDPTGKLPRVSHFDASAGWLPSNHHHDPLLLLQKITPDQPRREQPVLLTVNELQVQSQGRGGFDLKIDEVRPANAGRMWTVISGIIPYEAQQQLFYNALQANGEHRFASMQLKYASFEIERAKVTKYDTNELNWKPLDLNAVSLEIESWKTVGKEVVPQEAILPEMVFPLGPRLGREWSFSEVGHPAFEELYKQSLIQAKQLPKRNADPERVENPFQEEVRQPHKNIPQKQAKNIPNRLFRFFDFSVKPGESYRYRVRLMLKNPNYQVPVEHVVNPKITYKKYLVTRWSEPTETVSIGSDFEIFVGKVQPETHTRDANVDLLIRAWIYEEGVYGIFPIEKVSLSKVLNFQHAKLIAPSIDGKNAFERTMDLSTDLMIMEIEGGRKIRDGSSPKYSGTVTFLTPSGELKVSIQEEDLGGYRIVKGEYQRLKELLENQKIRESVRDFLP